MARPPRSLVHDIEVLRQPDDVSCGPTCLTQVLRYFGDERDFDAVAPYVDRNADGGTVGVNLGRAALALGYGATIYTYNLRVFDPTWAALEPDALRGKLVARAAAVADDPPLTRILDAYRAYLDAGGEVAFGDLDRALLVEHLAQGRPIVCGLSATHLYGTPREIAATNQPDDVAGEPAGHFVVIGGYLDRGARFVVFDPYLNNPVAEGQRYEVTERRLLNAILLGDVTFDGVLLLVHP